MFIGRCALTSYSVAVFYGSREWRKVVFGIDVLSEDTTQTVCRHEPEPRRLSANMTKNKYTLLRIISTCLCIELSRTPTHRHTLWGLTSIVNDFNSQNRCHLKNSDEGFVHWRQREGRHAMTTCHLADVYSTVTYTDTWTLSSGDPVHTPKFKYKLLFQAGVLMSRTHSNTGKHTHWTYSPSECSHYCHIVTGPAERWDNDCIIWSCFDANIWTISMHLLHNRTDWPKASMFY